MLSMAFLFSYQSDSFLPSFHVTSGLIAAWLFALVVVCAGENTWPARALLALSISTLTAILVFVSLSFLQNNQEGRK